MENAQQLLSLIKSDTALSNIEKAELLTKLNSADKVSHFIKGLETGGASLVLAKFFNLSPKAQYLITLAGYGIGKYLLDESRKRDKFLQYDEEKGIYNINA